MADIRVERKSGSKAWLWVLFALIVVALVLFLLYRAGYIGVAQLESSERAPLGPLALTAASILQEVSHG